MQLFGHGFLRGDCSKTDNPDDVKHSWDSEEWESCSTTEGWAGYTYFVSWWNTENVNSEPYIKRSIHAEDAEIINDEACWKSGTMEAQIAKAFWDLDDSNNEGPGSEVSAPDSLNLDTLFIAQGWQEFSLGILNRQSYEWDNDIWPYDHAVNVWDYHENYKAVMTNPDAFTDTFVYHNCLEGQDFN